ncbi:MULTISPECIES: helix-turn-helix transcriptional regulator [unclassified Clostridium]|uniref:helix-turn-helix transcriptional regulator n=1 Tax=unclassified Clostridium TaxID=2614128 RepID=UPI001DD01BD8|nr:MULTISPECIES: helix-turn-helix transcriptional regulator [unclassified Clostridium]HBJ1646726.1 helix-turn-helix transcriptional regulator [Clostridium botulinum]
MSKILKAARIQKNLNQKELCMKVGIGLNSLVKLEKGDYSTLRYPIMLKLSYVLEKTPQELFFSE